MESHEPSWRTTMLTLAGILLVAAGPLQSRTGTPIGRLPDSVEPRAYTLDLDVDPDGPSFEGRVSIDLEILKPDDAFWIHGLGIEAHRVRLERVGQAPISGHYEEVDPTGVSRVSFDETVPAGPYRLSIDYRAPLSDELAGFFRTEQGGDVYALAKSESVQARRAFPGFDEPRFKTPFAISITTHGGDLAISNGSVVERTELPGGRTRLRFATTPPLPTYLVSLAVGPFEIVEGPSLPPNRIRKRAVPVRGIARRGKAAGLAFILSLTPEFVLRLEDMVGIPYPYEKLDIVAAPDWPSGATELAGAITYRESVIVVDGEPPPARKRRLAGVHAHELAHTWFGNLVTPPWWEDLWLKESFASWAETPVLTGWDPDGGHDLDAAESAFRAMRTDALASARSVRQPIDRNQDIRNAYDRSVYSKGPAVIGMVAAYLGRERFEGALHVYLDRYADGVLGSGDFFDLLGDLTHDPRIPEVFSDFVNRPGVPRIAVRVACPDGGPARLQLAQSRYRPLGSSIDPAFTYATPIVLAYGTDSHGPETARAVLEEPSAELALPEESRCPTWVLPNAGGMGYYRFALDDAGWAALAARFSELSPREALAVVDSAGAGFEAGEISIESFFEIVRRSARSPVRQVVQAPFDLLRRLERYLVPRDVGDAFRGRIRDLYRERYEELSPDSDEGGRLLRLSLRSLLAETGRDPALRRELSSRAARYLGMEGPRDATALSTDELSLALSTAVEESGAPVFDAILSARETMDDAYFREASLEALGSAKTPELARRAFAYALEPQRPASETARILRSLAANRDVEDEVWAWIRDGFPEVVTRFPDQWRRSTPSLAGATCDPRRIDEVEALFTRHGSLAPGHEQSLAQTTEAIHLCHVLTGAKAKELASWLR